jgi:hypothetical protein
MRWSASLVLYGCPYRMVPSGRLQAAQRARNVHLNFKLEFLDDHNTFG